ncbi:MAG: HNH endonuclease signature motif containing protein [Burkholderiales bacterium]
MGKPRILSEEQHARMLVYQRAYYAENRVRVRARQKSQKEANLERHKEMARESRARRKEKIAAYAKAHPRTWADRKPEDPEVRRQRDAKYRKENRDKDLARKRAAYMAANKETVRLRAAERNREKRAERRVVEARWKAANNDKVRIYRQNRDRREKVDAGVLSVGLVRKLLLLQSSKCACCRVDLGKTKYHLDHVMPIALGGEHADSNMQILCATCNLSKSAKHPVEFMQQRGYLL